MPEVLLPEPSAQGRQHDQTAVRTEGIDGLLDAYPEVKFLVDAGYRGLANDHSDQVIAPPAHISEMRKGFAQWREELTANPP